MLRILSAVGMSIVLLCSMTAYGQDKGKKPKDQKSAKYFAKELAKAAKDRQARIKDLEALAELGDDLMVLRKRIEQANKDGTDSETLRTKYNDAVAFYNKALPVISGAVADATKKYNDRVAEYNNWLQTQQISAK